MEFHDNAMDMDAGMHGDMDLDMDVDPMHGAELTTAMQAHQHMKQAERKAKLQAKAKGGGGGGNIGDSTGDIASSAEDVGAGAQGTGTEEKSELDSDEKKQTCYEWFFGAAVDAQDGTHSTGNDLLDYYYRGDPELRQEPIEIKHNSIERKLIYYAFAWLWCGCWEPKYKITNKYAIGEEWVCCPKDRGCTMCIKVRFIVCFLFVFVCVCFDCVFIMLCVLFVCLFGLY